MEEVGAVGKVIELRICSTKKSVKAARKMKPAKQGKGAVKTADLIYKTKQ
ncbi:hypothetical protein Ccel_3021 [Ruminiclostridium cellulolyticum H10]|uniref:Uncharacterized protein n=1 Tax=Ruminiclostridium cellulolyticum (strain ATCC 35319 / DSM 5812 / JCM 6584 / H10) TaxID=394503 RepID=B8I8Y1_RUMCH|nr:hypothetical protein Ccel_3021 [Ruminiclostridium cellulolyticum H10]